MPELEFNQLSPVEIEITSRKEVRRHPHRDRQQHIPSERRCNFINQTTDKSTIPAYAVMQPKDRNETGCILDADGQPFVLAIQRNEEPCDLFYVNGPEEVPHNEPGRCMTLMADIPTRVMIDPAADPALHDCFGPIEDQWYLGRSKFGFTWLGMHADEDDTAWFQRQQTHLLLGKPASSIANGASGPVNLWHGTPGSETVTPGPLTLTVFNRSGSTKTTSDFVFPQRVNRDKWYLPVEGGGAAGISIVTITSAVKDANGLYPGKLITPTASGDFDLTTPLVAGTDIWVATLAQDHMVLSGKYYLGSPAGTATSGAVERDLYLAKDEISTARWIPFTVAADDVTIPAWGCCHGYADSTVDGQTNLKLTQPSALFRRHYFFNGPTAVAAEGHGICTMDWPAAGLTTGAWTVAVGDQLGPTPSSFELTRYHPGFMAKSTDLGSDQVLVIPDGAEVVWGRADAATAAGSTVTVRIYARSGGSEFDTGLTVTGLCVEKLSDEEKVIATFACAEWRVASAKVPSRLRCKNGSASYVHGGGTAKVTSVLSADIAIGGLAFDGGNDQIDVSTDGLYRIDLSLECIRGTAAVGSNDLRWEIYKNGSSLTGSDRTFSQLPAMVDPLSTSNRIYAAHHMHNFAQLVSGDYIELYLAFTPAETISIRNLVLTMERIGA